MKILKISIISITLMLFSITSYADECANIKMDSSVNIIKKLKCKAGGSSNNVEASSAESSSESTENLSEPKEKKKGILSKLFKKPTWVK
jgi:hypothetical protein